MEFERWFECRCYGVISLIHWIGGTGKRISAGAYLALRGSIAGGGSLAAVSSLAREGSEERGFEALEAIGSLVPPFSGPGI